MASTRERFRQLSLSSNEIKQLTGWPDAMVEDYLNILQDIIIVADEVDRITTLSNSALTQIAENTSSIQQNFSTSSNNAEGLAQANLKIEDISQLQAHLMGRIDAFFVEFYKNRDRINDLEQLAIV